MAVTFEILPGGDASLFTISGASGVWSNTATLFEGVYTFDIRAFDTAPLVHSNTLDVTVVVIAAGSSTTEVIGSSMVVTIASSEGITPGEVSSAAPSTTIEFLLCDCSTTPSTVPSAAPEASQVPSAAPEASSAAPEASSAAPAPCAEGNICGTPNSDPTLFVTMSWLDMNIETKDFLNCDWCNGETKEVYATDYFDGAGPYTGQTG